MNADTIAQHFYEQGKADALKQSIAKSKNVSMDPRQTQKQVDVGGLNDYSEKRYGVLLDLEYAGTLYKNIEFLLDDRGNRTPILLNRKVMKMLNVMVNPDRKYITTTRYSIDK